MSRVAVDVMYCARGHMYFRATHLPGKRTATSCPNPECIKEAWGRSPHVRTYAPSPQLRTCAHCHKLVTEHVSGKHCLFAPTCFRPVEIPDVLQLYRSPRPLRVYFLWSPSDFTVHQRPKRKG